MKNIYFAFLLFITFLTNGQGVFQSFDGTKIYFETEGNGPAVVLLHGFMNTGASWKRGKLPAKLVEAGYKVIIPDLRGNGKSDKPHDLKNYQKDAEIRDIMALMKYLNIKKYHVVGYSRGAILAAKLITLDTKHILSATLGGVGLDFTNPDWARRIMFAEAFSGKAHLYPETQGAINYAKSINADTIALGHLQTTQPAASKEQLKNVKIPVLVIAGNQDHDNGNPAELAELFRNHKLVFVDGNHNNTHVSEAFAEEITLFLKSLKPIKIEK